MDKSISQVVHNRPDKIWSLLTYTVSPEINASGYAPRPFRRDTAEYLKELLDEVRTQ